MTNRKKSNGNFPGGQVKYFNEYYYGNGLVALNTMNNPDPWNMSRDINFYHKDVLGSITAMTDSYGDMGEEFKYGAYGSPYKGRFLNSQKNNPYGFTGQRFDAELRMYSFAYRTYNPVSMRWLTVDPSKDGTNWYQYVSGDPVNLWDPLGLLIEATYYVTEITDNDKGGETASGYIEVKNNDIDDSFVVKDVKTGGLAGGGKPHSSKPAPFGTYDIVEHTHPDNHYVGDKLYHRLVAQNDNYGELHIIDARECEEEG